MQPGDRAPQQPQQPEQPVCRFALGTAHPGGLLEQLGSGTRQPRRRQGTLRQRQAEKLMADSGDLPGGQRLDSGPDPGELLPGRPGVNAEVCQVRADLARAERSVRLAHGLHQTRLQGGPAACEPCIDEPPQAARPQRGEQPAVAEQPGQPGVGLGRDPRKRRADGIGRSGQQLPDRFLPLRAGQVADPDPGPVTPDLLLQRGRRLSLGLFGDRWQARPTGPPPAHGDGAPLATNMGAGPAETGIHQPAGDGRARNRPEACLFNKHL